MITYTLTFNGTEEHFMAGAIANGYTDGDVYEFVGKKLKTISIDNYVNVAIGYWSVRKGTDNYNAEQMYQAMINNITIIKT